jgi:predicted secreted protein
LLLGAPAPPAVDAPLIHCAPPNCGMCCSWCCCRLSLSVSLSLSLLKTATRCALLACSSLAAEDAGRVFVTDAILTTLMTASKSVYSWDIVVTRVGDKLFLDKRDGSSMDLLTVNETAPEQVRLCFLQHDDEDDDVPGTQPQPPPPPGPSAPPAVVCMCLVAAAVTRLRYMCTHWAGVTAAMPC